MLRLKTLKVKNCRGVLNGPDLNFERGGILLCGDNGTGKSSYIDALEKVLTGSCKPLEGIQGISWTNHAPHIQSTSHPEIELIITDGNTNHTITLDQNFSNSPQHVQQFVNSAKECPFLLRRKTILEFVNSQPKDRYKVLEGFLKLDDYYNFEENLKSNYQVIENQISSINNDISKIQRILSTNFDTANNDYIVIDSLIGQINIKNRVLGLNLISTFEEINVLKSQIDQKIQDCNFFPESDKISNFTSILKNISDIVNLKEEINVYIQRYSELLQEEKELKGHFYYEVLENGIKWIQEDDLTHCPLCNNEINVNDVMTFVYQKVSNNKKIVEIQSQFAITKNEITLKLSRQTEIIESARKYWDELNNIYFPNSLEIILSSLVQIEKDITNSVPIEQLQISVNIFFNCNFEEPIAEISKIIEDMKKSLEENSDYRDLVILKNSIINLQTYYPQYEILFQELEKNLEIEKNLKITLKLAEEGRKKAVQNFIQSIGLKANEYFQLIHSDESIGNPQLSVTERGFGSIVLASSFYDKIGDPRGYYSEGHLDSLGLCFFLAIRNLHKQKNPDFPLLILDDVLHSVDYQHRFKTAKLIFDNFHDYQIIITTHDRMWFEKLKLVSRNLPYKKYRISSWSVDDGPGFGDYKSDYEWLSSSEGTQANPADKIIKAGRLLEEILQNLCDSLSIKVPFRIHGDYTLAPLWDNFFSKSKSSTIYTHNKDLFETIEFLRFQRNWVGAHYNEWANGLTEDESEQFSDSVLKLYEIVYCMDCNRYIMTIPQFNDGKWRCRCDKLHYEKQR